MWIRGRSVNTTQHRLHDCKANEIKPFIWTKHKGTHGQTTLKPLDYIIFMDDFNVHPTFKKVQMHIFKK